MPSTDERIEEFAEASILAYELFGRDTKKALKWMRAENKDFFNSSPFEVCIRGQGKDLIKFLKKRLKK